jgi:hypothetical protein
MMMKALKRLVYGLGTLVSVLAAAAAHWKP